MDPLSVFLQFNTLACNFYTSCRSCSFSVFFSNRRRQTYELLVAQWEIAKSGQMINQRFLQKTRESNNVSQPASSSKSSIINNCKLGWGEPLFLRHNVSPRQFQYYYCVPSKQLFRYVNKMQFCVAYIQPSTAKTNHQHHLLHSPSEEENFLHLTGGMFSLQLKDHSTDFLLSL